MESESIKKSYPDFIVKTRVKRVLADLQTPVSTYLKVRDLFPESALLESSDFHGNENSASYIGIEPLIKFKLFEDNIRCEYPKGEIFEVNRSGSINVTEELNNFIHSVKINDPNDLSDINGFFGYTSYDAVKNFEDLEINSEQTGATLIPEMFYIFYRFIIVINHFKNELIIIENLVGNTDSKMDEISSLLETRNYASYNFSCKGEEKSFISDEEYKEMVRIGKGHCKRGDVFQIVLSRCYSQAFSGDDFKVYRALRSINPSPYLFYFDFGSFRIFGSSPETHCRISKGKVYIDPIAGTFKRTGDDDKDRKLAEKLLQDPKENAEHVMLVDLARNDLSKNTNDVRLEFYKEVHYYSHVIHLVSRVVGSVSETNNIIKIFADTFPAGTLSGAPKVRAMQLINDIERYKRGVYGGCIGYIGLNGELNQAITIRSFISKNNELFYQAGAGIVAHSDVDSELQEVNNKLGALKKAINLAEGIIN